MVYCPAVDSLTTNYRLTGRGRAMMSRQAVRVFAYADVAGTARYHHATTAALAILGMTGGRMQIRRPGKEAPFCRDSRIVLVTQSSRTLRDHREVTT